MVEEKLTHDEISALPFPDKLRLLVGMNLEYWGDRRNNLSVQSFKMVLPQIPYGVSLQWADRTSQNGNHAHHGHDKVFSFEFEANILGRKPKYYVKGYYFTKETLEGVVIQSFREVEVPPIPISGS